MFCDMANIPSRRTRNGTSPTSVRMCIVCAMIKVNLNCTHGGIQVLYRTAGEPSQAYGGNDILQFRREAFAWR